LIHTQVAGVQTVHFPAVFVIYTQMTAVKSFLYAWNGSLMLMQACLLEGCDGMTPEAVGILIGPSGDIPATAVKDALLAE
jgi:hypothetical protein